MAKAATRSDAEIKKLLKETAKMTIKEAAKHIGVSTGTLYNWKTKKPSVKAATPVTSKKVISILKALKEKIAKLEKELI